MLKIKGLIFLAIPLAIGLAGCGDSTGGHGIYRSRDMVTVFVPLPDTSEIAETKVVEDKTLHIEIDTGEKIVPREIKFQTRFFPVVDPDETLEIHGRSRINDYVVVHLRVTHPEHKASRFVKMSSHRFYNFKITNPDKDPEPFENSGAFRVGDKIMAYCRLQDNIDSQPKGIKINIGGVEVKHTAATINTHIITEDEIGERLLILEDYKIDKDQKIRNLHFLLKDLAPHETVEIEEVTNLGDKIVIAELKVLPRENQPPNDSIFKDR